jgi:hypothetical protein
MSNDAHYYEWCIVLSGGERHDFESDFTEYD